MGIINVLHSIKVSLNWFILVIIMKIRAKNDDVDCNHTNNDNRHPHLYHHHHYQHPHHHYYHSLFYHVISDSVLLEDDNTGHPPELLEDMDG